MEACIVKIPLLSNKAVYIIAAYYSSGNNNENLKSELQLLFESLNLDNLDNLYLLAGDLNAKHQNWGNTVGNPKGGILKQWLDDNDIRFRCKLYASALPSYPRCGSYLDLCIADHRMTINTENNTFYIQLLIGKSDFYFFSSIN